jgi:GT2 family glycosyltransferase
MSKVSVIVVVYNSRKFLPQVFEAIFNQSHSDIEVFAVLNKSTDGSKEFIQTHFPRTVLIEPGTNTGFAGGNNLAIRQSVGEFIQLVNPDLIMSKNYIEQLLPAFNDPKLAAAVGKLLRYDFDSNQSLDIIDSAGVTMQSSGRARDRGQLERDRGQYNSAQQVFGVTGAAPMYRKSALEEVAFQGEYFDEDFLAYWEDVDLSWRLNNAGYKNWYQPQAVAYHGRGAGQAKGGYLHFLHFIKHHSKISPAIRRLNYKNHILMYLKNAKSIHPMFVLRELVMLVYIIIFETSTLTVLPQLWRQLPAMRQKRAAQTLS